MPADDSEQDGNVTMTADSTTIMIDVSPHIHQLDNDVRFLSSLEFDAQAALVLSTVINTSARAYANTKWPIDPTFKDMMSCEERLVSNQEVRDDLEKAHSSGQYAEIRNRREWQSQHSPSLY